MKHGYASYNRTLHDASGVMTISRVGGGIPSVIVRPASTCGVSATVWSGSKGVNFRVDGWTFAVITELDETELYDVAAI